MNSFSTALTSGAMANLEELDNQIGDEGMKSFSTALASGAMAKLKRLLLDDMSDELKAIWAERRIEDVVQPANSDRSGWLGVDGDDAIYKEEFDYGEEEEDDDEGWYDDDDEGSPGSTGCVAWE
eukprot:5922824-Prymnesium_polylepis.2